MRVLHTLWSADFGGIERLALDLATAQSQRGIVPMFLFGQARGRMLPGFERSGLNVLDAKLRWGWDRNAARRQQVASLMREVDVIHMHAFTPPFASAAYQSSAKVLFTDHGNYGLGRQWTLRDRIKRRLQRRFYQQRVDFVSFNSNYTHGLANQSFGKSLPACEVVYNGIDMSASRLNPEPLPAQWNERLAGKFVVGTTSRLAGFKRVDRLIEAFAAFAYEKPQCVLLIVGDGPLRDELHKHSGRIGIEGQVLFAGFQDAVASFQNSMDVCVFPSEGEPFGLVAVETLALGKPTIVMSDGGGIVEVVEPVEPGNVVDGVEALAARLQQFWERKHQAGNDRSEWESKRIEWSKRFDIQRMADEFDRIYSLLVSSNSVRGCVSC